KPWEVFADSGRTTRILRSFLAAVLALFFAAEATFSAVMIWYGWGNKPYYSKADTAVVMGAEIRDGAPSKIFQSRLEKALGYLTDLPDTRVVVTGGQGKKETRAEGDVAAEWLMAKGIAPERIIIDNQSLDTCENMENTARLLAENGLPPKVVICTDGCHQMRSQLYAKMNGMTATGIASPTPWGLFPAYWLREQAGICEAVLIKYGVLANRR
ncbi:MAG: YdcF family protein, partial [Angelakisella sp.]